MSKTGKYLTLALLGLVFLGGFAAGGMYAGGRLFAHLQHIPSEAVTLTTLPDYWAEFGHIRKVKQSLFLGALAAAAPRGRQALRELGVVGVKPQAHNVDGGACKGDRNFGAREVSHALRVGCGGGAVLAADLIMVCQRPQFDTVGLGAFGQGFGGQGSIGHHRVAVEVGIENGCHTAILRPGP